MSWDRSNASQLFGEILLQLGSSLSPRWAQWGLPRLLASTLSIAAASFFSESGVGGTSPSALRSLSVFLPPSWQSDAGVRVRCESGKAQRTDWRFAEMSVHHRHACCEALNGYVVILSVGNRPDVGSIEFARERRLHNGGEVCGAPSRKCSKPRIAEYLSFLSCWRRRPSPRRRNVKPSSSRAPFICLVRVSQRVLPRLLCVLLAYTPQVGTCVQSIKHCNSVNIRTKNHAFLMFSYVTVSLFFSRKKVGARAADSGGVGEECFMSAEYFFFGQMRRRRCTTGTVLWLDTFYEV